MSLEKARTVILGLFDKFGAILLSIIALAFSIYSYYQAEKTQEFVSQTEAIKIEYDIYRELSKLQLDKPFLTHLFAQSPAVYSWTSAKIQKALEGIPLAERAKLSLEEISLAHHILTTYEETYFHWQTAVAAGNQHLALLLSDNLDYFNDLLCNSRLVWLWDNPNDPLGKIFSEQLVSYYESHVQKSCDVTPDSSGPITPPFPKDGGQHG